MFVPLKREKMLTVSLHNHHHHHLPASGGGILLYGM